MTDRIKVNKSFTFKSKQYDKGGSILKSKFTEIELQVLSQLNLIDYKPKRVTKKGDK